MNRISQEGADHINQLIGGIVDSIDKNLSDAKSGKGKKAVPAVDAIADELAALIELARQVEWEWDKA